MNTPCAAKNRRYIGVCCDTPMPGRRPSGLPTKDSFKNIRLTPTEKAHLDRLAAQRGIAGTQLIRQTLIQAGVLPQEAATAE